MMSWPTAKARCNVERKPGKGAGMKFARHSRVEAAAEVAQQEGGAMDNGSVWQILETDTEVFSDGARPDVGIANAVAVGVLVWVLLLLVIYFAFH